LGDRESGNNFDFLRVLAALMVLISHSYVLSGRPGDEPLLRLTGLEGFGELGVSAFFVISGFLIAASFERTPNVPAFVANRVLRIVPALAVVVVLSALILGPLVSSLPVSDYFGRSQTWSYVARNILVYPVTYELPGVFDGNPFPRAVNGSLWTLRLEFTFYLMVAGLGWWGVLRRAHVAVTCAFAIGYGATLLQPDSFGSNLPLLFARNGLLFFAGASLYCWHGTGRWHRRAVATVAAIALALALPSGFWAPVVMPLALPVLVIAFALNPLPIVARWGRFGDFSYGIYVYAFPVQQFLMYRYGPGTLSAEMLAVVALMLVLPLAAASWWLVERRALAAKGAVGTWLSGVDRMQRRSSRASESRLGSN
jgi:peptidoglycan/LPS O-acetylase OafA/YrhL